MAEVAVYGVWQGSRGVWGGFRGVWEGSGRFLESGEVQKEAGWCLGRSERVMVGVWWGSRRGL